MSQTDDFTRLHAAFDIDDAVFAERFEDVLDHLVAKCPVAHSTIGPTGGYHAFNRYRDVRRAGQDWRTFSSSDGWMMDPPAGNLKIIPEDTDPPSHSEWRRVLNPYFTAEACTALEPHARAYAAALVARFAERGECEFVSDFAAQLPGLILFKHILPVPVEDLPAMFKDIDLYSFGPLAGRVDAFGRVYTYLQKFLGERAQQPPQHDLVDVLLAGVDRVGAPCPWDDKVHTALDVVFGGLATTTHAMSGAVYELAVKPEVRQALATAPTHMRTAVEETVRLYAPVVAVGRTVRADTELGGVALKAGARIALNYAAASRDPEVCSNPQNFDIHRQEVVHTAFGVGPHRCLGEHLARVEIRIAIEEFLKRIPEFELRPGTRPQYESGQLRTMKNLYLRWPL